MWQFLWALFIVILFIFAFDIIASASEKIRFFNSVKMLLRFQDNEFAELSNVDPKQEPNA